MADSNMVRVEKVKTISEEYDQLYHYTTAIGLHGILTSQTLRASNYSFLNDEKEIGGFLEERLPGILFDEVDKGVKQHCLNNSKHRSFIKEHGGFEAVSRKIIDELTQTISKALLDINDPYILSFCGAKTDHIQIDGLLSQWRGYGLDGGYAIVFDSKGIEELLKQEVESYCYGYLHIGDVDYYNPITKQHSNLPEVKEYEKAIRDSVRRYVATNNSNEMNDTYTPITALSGLHKHIGFQEEAEVRVIAIPPCKELLKQARDSGDVRPEKSKDFMTRHGILVPYINLFDFGGEGKRLPIKNIIVGPSSDARKRKKSVQLLLEQCGIDAEVTCSNIPYIGR